MVLDILPTAIVLKICFELQSRIQKMSSTIAVVNKKVVNCNSAYNICQLQWWIKMQKSKKNS